MNASQPPTNEKPPSYEAATGGVVLEPAAPGGVPAPPVVGADGVGAGPQYAPLPPPPAQYTYPAPAATGAPYPVQQPPAGGAMPGVHYPQQQQMMYPGYPGNPGGYPAVNPDTNTYVHPTTTVQPGITSAHMRRRRILISLGVGFVILVLVINVIRFIFLS